MKVAFDHQSICTIFILLLIDFNFQLAAKISIDKWIQISVHHSSDIPGLYLGTMVFDHAVRVEHIRTNLATPGNLGLLTADFIQLLAFFLDFALIQLGTQHRHRTLTVFDLGTFGLTTHNNAGW